MPTCENCQRDFVPNRGHSVARFCSVSCYHAFGRRGNRKEEVKGVRMTLRPDHPLAPPSGLVPVHRIVLFDKIGAGPHPCNWCQRTLYWKTGKNSRSADAIFVDHLDWDRSNNSPDNLVPSCNNCNAHRVRGGERSLIQPGEEFIQMANGSRTRAVRRECERCGESFLAIPAFVRQGRARFCSRACIWKKQT